MENITQQRDELDAQVLQLNSRVQILEAQLSDNQELLEEESRQKLVAQSQARNLQSDLESFKDQREEFSDQQLRHENELVALRAQLADQNRRALLDSGNSLEELKRQHQKDQESLKTEVEIAVLAKDRAERGRRKIQEEVCFLNVRLIK